MDIYSWIVSIIFIVLVFVVKPMLTQINNSIIFHPYKTTQAEMFKIFKNYGNHIKHIEFNSNDGTKLSGALINHYKEPSFDDIVFLYSHGNACWIGNIIECDSIYMLSKYGSVFVYDYGGYGCSDGYVSENGCYENILGAWKFLRQQHVSNDKIIVFGHSLGNSMTTKLVSILVNTNKQLPKGMILWSPFKSVKEMAKRIISCGEYLTVVDFDNVKNLEKINNKIPIIILHSKNDEVIPFEHSEFISIKIGCKLIEIDGYHCNFVANDDVIKSIEDMINNK